MFILRETFCAESNSESFCIKITLGSFRIKITTCRMGCVSISGDPCAITNYCMNSYLVLQVTRAYIQQTAFSLCFQRSWLVETGLGLTDSRFWLVGPCCLALVGLLHTSSWNASMSFHVQGEVVRPEWISFKDKSSGIIFWMNSDLSCGSSFFYKFLSMRNVSMIDVLKDLLNWRAHKWHLNGFWPEKKYLSNTKCHKMTFLVGFSYINILLWQNNLSLLKLYVVWQFSQIVT